MDSLPPADVDGNLVPIRCALISVSDKTGIVEFALGLRAMGVEILSTGGTAELLTSSGVDVTPVEQVTGQPEILGGRVKTLHPKIHGAILADRGLPEHIAQLESLGRPPIDLVCVDLYPFEQTVAKADVSIEEAIEQMDIGGPAMLRAAAKNFRWVLTITEGMDRSACLARLRELGGASDLAMRREGFARAIELTSRYDRGIHEWMAPRLEVAPRAVQLRYGENPHQQGATLTARAGARGASTAELLHGKPLSYNNALDSDAALALVRALASWDPASAHACVIKHTNPCGASSAATSARAIELALAGDTVAAFGGIFASSAEIEENAARTLCGPTVFPEVLLAPSYTDGALAMLRDRWKNLRILRTAPMDRITPPQRVGRDLMDGRLEQPADLLCLRREDLKHQAGPAPEVHELDLAIFADHVGRALISNAVCICQRTRDGAMWVVGVGCGCVDRVSACRIAAEKAGDRIRGALVFSDGFFPFDDGPEILIRAGVSLIAHPGGSKRDHETFLACDRASVTCMTTGVRRFRH